MTCVVARTTACRYALVFTKRFFTLRARAYTLASRLPLLPQPIAQSFQVCAVSSVRHAVACILCAALCAGANYYDFWHGCQEMVQMTSIVSPPTVASNKYVPFVHDLALESQKSAAMGTREVLRPVLVEAYLRGHLEFYSLFTQARLLACPIHNQHSLVQLIVCQSVPAFVSTWSPTRFLTLAYHTRLTVVSSITRNYVVIRGPPCRDVCRWRRRSSWWAPAHTGTRRCSLTSRPSAARARRIFCAWAAIVPPRVCARVCVWLGFRRRRV